MTRKDNIPPPPPPGPPNRLQCGTCGYTAPADKYNHTCYLGITASILLMAMGCIPLVVIVFKIIEAFANQ